MREKVVGHDGFDYLERAGASLMSDEDKTLNKSSSFGTWADMDYNVLSECAG